MSALPFQRGIGRDREKFPFGSPAKFNVHLRRQSLRGSAERRRHLRGEVAETSCCAVCACVRVSVPQVSPRPTPLLSHPERSSSSALFRSSPLTARFLIGIYGDSVQSHPYRRPSTPCGSLSSSRSVYQHIPYHVVGGGGTCIDVAAPCVWSGWTQLVLYARVWTD